MEQGRYLHGEVGVVDGRRVDADIDEVGGRLEVVAAGRLQNW